jgi:hypothetical protein
MSIQSNIGEHPNRNVRTREPGLGADGVNLGIGDMTRGCVEQPLYGLTPALTIQQTDLGQSFQLAGKRPCR